MPEDFAQSDALAYVEPLPSEELTADEREALDRVNQKIAGAQSLEDAIDFLFEETRVICGCDRICLATLSEDGHRATSRYVKATYQPLLLKQGYSQDLAHSSLGEVIRSGRPRIIRDLEAYAAEHPDSPSTKLLIEEGVRSSMTCPLSVDGRTVGLLFRSSRHKDRFTARQARLHLAISERLSQAVEKAAIIEQLRSANRAYMKLLSFVTHELKSPVASLVMTAELLLDGFWGDLQAQQRERIERMVFQGQYLLTLIRDYLNLSRLEEGQMRITPRSDVDFVKQVFEPSRRIIQPWLEGKSMHLERDFDEPPPLVQCDPELMGIVMTNLLSNACKYGQKDGKVRCAVHLREGRLRVSVFNEGPGFDEEQKSRLFRKFSRLDDPQLRKAKGTGVGLYTVWEIIRRHGGTVRAESEKGRWAEFVFEIPQPLPEDINGGE